MLTLYDFGNSVCCQKVRITLCAKGIGWQPVRVDLFKAEQFDPSYLKLNPNGIVPTLVHEGRAIIESTLICEYLDETFPQPRVTPDDPWLRTRMRLWSKMVDEALFEGVAEISFSAMFRERMRTMPAAIRERRFQNVGDPRRRDRMTSTFELGTRSPFVRHGIAAFERAFGMLEQALMHGGPWILGERPTLADINLMPLLARLEFLGLADLWIRDRPHVTAWWAAARDWPSYQRGLRDLISEAEMAEMRAAGEKIADDVSEILTEVRDGIQPADTSFTWQRLVERPSATEMC
jgi:glutathione S-transferase